jgi:pimeloyl-ACP methyl ester carboxylesterase
MKRTVVCVIACLLLILAPIAACASPLKDYYAAQGIYTDALACMASYSNRLGKIAISRLAQEGWKAQYFDIKKKLADAKFLLLKKTDPASGHTTVLLAVTGTESEKDVKSDLKYQQVYYAGNTYADFAANAREKNINDNLPKVHKGFDQVTQIALTADILKGPGELTIADYLLAHPNHKLILTGHSLGGAVATLYGARLLSLGVRPEQVKVVTFGAPAVGNAAFAKLFQDKLDLTRIVVSGDQITSVLQDMIGGYVQFGHEIHWQAPDDIVMHPHHIPVYLNAAIRNYYQNRRLAIQAGALSLPLQTSDQEASRVYVAPVQNELSPALQGEFFYMHELLWDEDRTLFPSYVLAAGNEKLKSSLAKAKSDGCRWLAAAEIEAHPSKTEAGVFYITLNQTLYNVATGNIVNMYSFTDSSEHLTPLGAFLNDIRKWREEKPFSVTLI